MSQTDGQTDDLHQHYALCGASQGNNSVSCFNLFEKEVGKMPVFHRSRYGPRR